MPRAARLALWVAPGLAFCVYSAWYAHRVNGSNGFPLDDPWIHLQFARNLHDFGSYSYWRDQMVTSGSTSPLYTALLALGFFVTRHEMILAYVLGVAGLVAAGLAMARLARQCVPEAPLLGAVAAMLLVLEPRLQWVALSGMETTWFIALLLVALAEFRARHAIRLGVATGLLLWTRPEALWAAAAMGADAWYHARVARPAPTDGPKSWLLRAAVMAALFGLLYIAFNLRLSGTLLPNTVAAKLQYYAQRTPDFPLRLLQFVGFGPQLFLAPFGLIGAASIALRLVRREREPLLVGASFSLLLAAALWIKLPYLFHNGRYAMPMLPFVTLVGMRGIAVTLAWAQRRFPGLERGLALGTLRAAVLAIVIGVFAYGAWQARLGYAQTTGFITKVQVRTALWLRDHAPSNAVIATHDIGAIAYYSGRRVVDMVGLVSPELIPTIGRLDALPGALRGAGVTHVAALESWFSIDNANALFQTDERQPEVMKVFEFDPERVHFLSPEVAHMLRSGLVALTRGDPAHAGPLFQQAVLADPLSSRAHLYLGRAYIAAGASTQAMAEIERALALHPRYWDAQLARAELLASERDAPGAIRVLESLIVDEPSYAPAYRALGWLYAEFEHDTAKANALDERYRALTANP